LEQKQNNQIQANYTYPANQIVLCIDDNSSVMMSFSGIKHEDFKNLKKEFGKDG
jgi:hypothetical protein